jgi:hypothetical protein
MSQQVSEAQGAPVVDGEDAAGEDAGAIELPGWPALDWLPRFRAAAAAWEY